jgi:hypothetical protein
MEEKTRETIPKLTEEFLFSFLILLIVWVGYIFVFSTRAGSSTLLSPFLTPMM